MKQITIFGIILLLLVSPVVALSIDGYVSENKSIRDIFYEEILKAKIDNSWIIIKDDTIPVCDHTDILARLDAIEIRLDAIEATLNISYEEPKEGTLPLYECFVEQSTKECPWGISGGFHTRCYDTFDFILNKTDGWDYCIDGWKLIENVADI